MRGEVLVGPERRRRWSEDEKARIIEESLQPGAQVADIARRHGVSRGLLYTWRRAARCAPTSPVVVPEPAFVPVLLSAPEEPQAATASETTEQDRASRRPPKRRTANGGEIEVVLPGGARLTLRGRVEATALRAVLAALKA
ncbi:MAG TPA: transposase [Bradyrhizobium sp.]|nr:transposase [Bradyrhizobium sp.]